MNFLDLKLRNIKQCQITSFDPMRFDAQSTNETVDRLRARRVPASLEVLLRCLGFTFLAACLTFAGCRKPSFARYQRTFYGGSISRTDTVGGNYYFHDFRIPRHCESIIREDPYLGQTKFEIRKRGILRQYWVFDIHGKPIVYKFYDRHESIKLVLSMNRTEYCGNNEQAICFMVERWRNKKHRKGFNVENGRISTMSMDRMLMSFFPSGKREIRIDHDGDYHVRRARLWNEKGDCIADTTFANPPSMSSIRPNIDVLLQRMAQQKK